MEWLKSLVAKTHILGYTCKIGTNTWLVMTVLKHHHPIILIYLVKRLTWKEVSNDQCNHTKFSHPFIHHPFSLNNIQLKSLLTIQNTVCTMYGAIISSIQSHMCQKPRYLSHQMGSMRILKHYTISVHLCIKNNENK